MTHHVLMAPGGPMRVQDAGLDEHLLLSSSVLLMCFFHSFFFKEKGKKIKATYSSL